MPTYRAYRLDAGRKIRTGEWFEAVNDEDAKRLAHHLCDDDSVAVELWEAARPVESIECHPPAHAVGQ